MSKARIRKKDDGDSSNGKLLHEVEAISKALYLDRNPSRSTASTVSSRSKSAGKAPMPDPKLKSKIGNEGSSQKDKKGFWNWRPLKAFSHVRNRRFNCRFTLQVHSIEGLPSSFNDSSMCVHWKRRDGGCMTRPVKVSEGIAEFEENLLHTCSVYGSRSGPHHSAKYEGKHFLLYAADHSHPELDLGKHRVDLTRLLPLSLEELEEDKSTGKWTTSFRLSGKAAGATLNVSFRYSVIGDNGNALQDMQNIPEALGVRRNPSNAGIKFDQGDGRDTIRRTESLPSSSKHQSNAFVEDIKDLHEILPVSKSGLKISMGTTYEKSKEEKTLSIKEKAEIQASQETNEHIKSTFNDLRDGTKQDDEKDSDVNDYSVIEQGVEISSKEQVIAEDGITESADDLVSGGHGIVDINVSEQVANEESTSPEFEGAGGCEGKLDFHGCKTEKDGLCSKKAIMKELESALNEVSNLEAAALDSPEEQEDYLEIKGNYKNRKGKSQSLDDITDFDIVANEFLDMLGIKHSPSGLSSEGDPESPREQLLRQFEKENGYSLFGFDMENVGQHEDEFDNGRLSEWPNMSNDFHISSTIQAAEAHRLANHARSKTKAKILEDLETETLMREWGMNENAFQASPPGSAGGFGSPIHLPPEEPFELPPLGDGLGPYLQTKNGGFLRSMNPLVFKNAKSGGSLVMQASSPVVVPAEMGTNVTEILQGLASVGIEKLSMQANKLMPLEDITGKTMQQVAWEASHFLDGCERLSDSLHDFGISQNITVTEERGWETSFRSRHKKHSPTPDNNETGSEYVSLEELAPLAMDKIEALSMEGLRIQSGMSNEDAPSNISAKSIGDISALQGKGANISGSLGLEGTAGLQLLDIRESSDDMDGLMGLSLSLDEWMKLDAGEIDDEEDEISERTSKILAAHRANSLDWIRGGSKGERRRGKGNRKCGLMGNNFTVGLMVQLRDPFRNYEPVGAPMLALIQVERMFVPPKPRIFKNVSEVKITDEDDESVVKKESVVPETEKPLEEETVLQFKITEVHVAGLKTEPGKKKIWGSSNQQQSGSRWLLANGMGKSNKHPFMKSKPFAKSASPATTKGQPGDTLWSISSRAQGDGPKWKDLAALNPHIRNPNIIFPNETLRLR